MCVHFSFPDSSKNYKCTIKSYLHRTVSCSWDHGTLLSTKLSLRFQMYGLHGSLPSCRLPVLYRNVEGKDHHELIATHGLCHILNKFINCPHVENRLRLKLHITWVCNWDSQPILHLQVPNDSSCVKVQQRLDLDQDHRISRGASIFPSPIQYL